MLRFRNAPPALLLIALLLSGCSNGAAPTPTAPAATATATMTPTVAASPATATATVPPTATATATPTITPPPPPPATPRAAASPATPVGSPARPGAATPATGVSGPVVAPPPPRVLGQPVGETARYRFYDPEGAYGAAVALLVAEGEAIYAEVAGRTGLRAEGPIAVVLQAQATSACAARGVAYRDTGQIGIFLTPTTAPTQLRLVLAHETTHVLHFATLRGPADGALLEGFANWASLRYWSAWQGLPDFEAAARGYLADGRFVALDNPPDDCTIATRDVIYNERASFVGYLIGRFGLERFLALSATGLRAPQSRLEVVADYQGVYGRDFGALLADWQGWLRGR